MKSQSRRRASDPVPAFIAAAAVLLWLAMIAKAPELRLPLWRFGWLLAWCAAITIGWAKVLAHADPQTFARVEIDYRQQAKPATVKQRIGDKIHPPYMIGIQPLRLWLTFQCRFIAAGAL